MTTENKSPMTILIATPVQEFLDYVSNLSLGEVMSVNNFLKMEYERTNAMRQSLLLAMEKAPKKDHKQIDKTIQDLMVILQLIEDRVVILTEISKSRSIKGWFSPFDKSYN